MWRALLTYTACVRLHARYDWYLYCGVLALFILRVGGGSIGPLGTFLFFLFLSISWSYI